MHKRHLTVIVLLASVLMSLAAASASARSIEITNSERGFRITWNPLRLEAAGRSIECPVTLEGNFAVHTFAKRAGTRVASVSELAVGTCTRGSVSVLIESLPWEITYNSFGGTLPTITELKFNTIREAFQVNLEGIICLATTRVEQPARGISRISSGAVTGFRMDETALIETTGGFFCTLPGKAHFAGEASSITVRGGTEAMRVRLI